LSGWCQDGTTASAEAVLPGRPATVTAAFTRLGADIVGRGRIRSPTARPTRTSSIREQIYVYVPLAPRATPVGIELTANDPTPAGRPSLFRSGERWRLALTFTDITTGVTKPLEVDLTC
jgi:hypothetical protein